MLAQEMIKPVLFITYQDSFKITKEGIQFLSSFETLKIAIITVIGPKHSGKSSLCYHIIHNHPQLNISNTHILPTSNHHDIWIYGIPQPNNTSAILLLDATGFDLDTNSDINYNKQLFILCCMISSTIIYNDTPNTNNDNTLRQFIKYISDIKIKKNISINKDYMPQLTYILHDTDDRDHTHYTIEQQFKQYEIYNKFNNVTHYLMPKPILDRNGNIDIEQSTHYINTCNLITADVIANVQNKRIGSVYINGDILYSILDYYIESVNENESHRIYKALNWVLSKIKEVTYNIKEDYLQQISKKKEKKTFADIITLIMDELIDTSIPNLCQCNKISMLLPDNSMSHITKYITELITLTKQEIMSTFNKSNDLYINNLVNSLSVHTNNKLEEITIEHIRDYIKNTSDDLITKFKQIISSNPYINSEAIINTLIEKMNKYIIKEMETILIHIIVLNENKQKSIDKFQQDIKKLKGNLEEEKDKFSKQNEIIIRLRTDIDILNNKLNSNTTTIASNQNNNNNNNSAINQQYNDIRAIALEKEINKLTEMNINKTNEINILEIKLKAQEKKTQNKTMNRGDIEDMKLKYNCIKVIVDKYKNMTDNLFENKNSNNIYQISKSSLDIINSNYKKSSTMMKELIVEIKDLKSKYETSINGSNEKINTLKFENDKLVDRLEKEEENRKDIICKNKIINDYAENMKKKEIEIENNKKVIVALTKELEQTKIDNSDINNINKVVESEIDYLLLVIGNILNKEKEAYNFHLNKITYLEKVRIEVDSYVKKKNIFK